MTRGAEKERSHKLRRTVLGLGGCVAIGAGLAVGPSVYDNWRHNTASTVLQRDYKQFTGRIVIAGAAVSGTHVRSSCEVGTDVNQDGSRGNSIHTILPGQQVELSDPGIVNAHGGPSKGGDRCATFNMPLSWNTNGLLQTQKGYVVINDLEVRPYVKLISEPGGHPQPYSDALLADSRLELVHMTGRGAADSAGRLIEDALMATPGVANN